MSRRFLSQYGIVLAVRPLISYIRNVIDAGACPRCHSADIALSKSRRYIDYLMRIFNRSPYRCRECRSRFYLSTSLEAKIRAQSRWLHQANRSRRRSKNPSASV